MLAQRARHGGEVSAVLPEHRDELGALALVRFGQRVRGENAVDDGARQVGARDRQTPRECECERAFERVLELADVERPVIREQRLDGVGCEREVLPIGREPCEEAGDQQRNVLAPIAQRRELEAHAVDPRQQIVTERAVAHHPPEVPVGRAHDAKLDIDRAITTDRCDLRLLEHAQERGLCGQRKIADLVEKQRPAVGLAREAEPIARRTRERALAVAEQLGLDELLRDRAAVDRDEAPASTRQLVDRARQELLAGATLAEHEHRRARLGDRASIVRDPREGRRQRA